jgi:hypothetical protein
VGKSNAGVQNLNSFAELVNSRTEKVRRTQTLSKVNELGLGVIYNWEFEMTYSDNIYDTKLLPPSEMSNRKESDIVKGKETSRYKSRFMYVGLSIQLPTLKRMQAHFEGKDDKGEPAKDVFHTVLREATRNEFDNGFYSSRRTLSNLYRAPQIIDIASHFDLGQLEEWYINDGATAAPLTTLQNNKENFPILMEKGSSMTPVAGLNSAGGGQGGPLKQPLMIQRGLSEWVMAAYFALYEGSKTVLDSRKDNFQSGIQKIKSSKQPLYIKLKDVFDLSVKLKMPSSSVANYFNNDLNLDVLKKAVVVLGLERPDQQDIVGDMRTKDHVGNKDVATFFEYLAYDTNDIIIRSDDKSKVLLARGSKGAFSTENRNKIVGAELDTLIKNGNSQSSIQINLSKKMREFDENLSVRLGNVLQNELKNYSGRIQKELLEIQKQKLKVQGYELIQQSFIKGIREKLSILKSDLKGTLDLQGIDISIVDSNKTKIDAARSEAERLVNAAIERIENFIIEAEEKSAEKSGVLKLAVAGKKPRKNTR